MTQSDPLAPPPYSASEIRKIESAPGRWNCIEVGVFRGEGDEREQVGAFSRNYRTLFRAFYAFRIEGRDYALYSPDYTATRVMDLPSCRDLGGEEPCSGGFCPVDFYVPCYFDREYRTNDGELRHFRVNEPAPAALHNRADRTTPLLSYPFGFVAGCVWGDDSSWKIQYLDLSRAAEGIIQREDRFGYIAKPDHLTLKQAIDMIDFANDPEEEWSSEITIAIQARFNVETGKFVGRDPWA